MQKKLFLGGCLAVALAAVLGGTVSAMSPDEGCASQTLPDPSRDNKVTLCHFTGSTDNPFIINEVSASAAATHYGHHGDCVNDGTSTICF
jgi:hypothetical protein